MNIYNLTELDIQAEANKVKDILISYLQIEGLLKDTAENICSQYIVVVQKKNLFGQIFDKFFNVKDNDLRFTVLKKITIKEG